MFGNASSTVEHASQSPYGITPRGREARHVVAVAWACRNGVGEVVAQWVAR